MDITNGIVIVDKEKGYTSHDVVNVIRKIFSTRKVGHTGTLDPDATGVLPICIGKATKVCDMLTFSDKEYEARVRLGIVTDTQDISGKVLAENNVDVTEAELQKAVNAHIGEINQIPPMYSALKVNGQKLCDLARKGIEVERKPRRITIYSAQMTDFDGTDFTLRVKCSKGTYIRTLCHDIGQMLGCGAVMTELRRISSSIFDVTSAHSLDELKALAEKNALSDVLIPIDAVFEEYPKLTVSGAVRKKVCNGAAAAVPASVGTYRVYDDDGKFLCIAEVRENAQNGKNTIKMTKAFFD